MADTTQNNAMAEIALALAMGFFSIMVLTMVSMGTAMVTQSVQKLDHPQIQVAENSEDQIETSQKAGGAEQVAPENLIIFHQGDFLDHELKKMDLSQMQAKEKVVLAVHPQSSMSETMKARAQINHENLTVLMLDKGWIKALEERS